MRSRIGLMAAMLMMAGMGGDPYFGTPRRVLSDEEKRRRNSKYLDHIHNTEGERQLHEFTVEGKKVMAYSKKDALKRFGTKKSKKRKK